MVLKGKRKKKKDMTGGRKKLVKSRKEGKKLVKLSDFKKTEAIKGRRGTLVW